MEFMAPSPTNSRFVASTTQSEHHADFGGGLIAISSTNHISHALGCSFWAGLKNF